VDFVRAWGDKTEIGVGRFLGWIELGTSKFYDWKQRYGKVNEHNAWVPRDHWLTEEEKRQIIAFAYDHPLDGYRRQTFMMLDADVVAASPTSVWRVLHQAGLLARVNGKPSRKGTGFVQPLRPHQDWHVDVSYLNIAGTFYFLCSLLDGYSRFIVHWEIRPTMEEGDVETIIQRARELYPHERPRIISDNGPQFIAKDFKEFIRLCGMTHVKTSPYYPQSNGKIERFHRTLKGDCIRTQTPLSLEDARRLVTNYVAYYNNIRLHSALGYITPKDMLAGRAQEIFDTRERKLGRGPRTSPDGAADDTPGRYGHSGPAQHRLHRRARCHHAGRGPRPAPLRSQQHPRRPATRSLPHARLAARPQPLLLGQPGREPLALLQMRQGRQCPRPLGRRHRPKPLRRRCGPLPAAQPAPANQSPNAARPQQATNPGTEKSTRRLGRKNRYNVVSRSNTLIR
jgi:transposase InsO family protein